MDKTVLKPELRFAAEAAYVISYKIWAPNSRIRTLTFPSKSDTMSI